jgi:hypothetical protein
MNSQKKAGFFVMKSRTDKVQTDQEYRFWEFPQQAGILEVHFRPGQAPQAKEKRQWLTTLKG